MNIELCTSTREMIIDLYKTIFYGREDPMVLIPINYFDLCLRSALESFEFDQTALSEILRSLCQERHESPFYSGVMEGKADYLNQLWQLQHNNEITMHRRNQDYLEGLRLQERIRELQQERDSLLREIEQLPLRGGTAQDR